MGGVHSSAGLSQLLAAAELDPVSKQLEHCQMVSLTGNISVGWSAMDTGQDLKELKDSYTMRKRTKNCRRIKTSSLLTVRKII